MSVFFWVILPILAKEQGDFLSTHQEEIFSQIIEIRARELERLSGLSLDGKLPKVVFDANMRSSVSKALFGVYDQKDQTIHFAPLLVDELRQKYSFLLMATNLLVLSKDDRLGKIIDHELGHFFTDQVSRRNNLGPWYTSELFDSVSDNEALGLRIIAEGIAFYFEHLRYPFTGSVTAEESFPLNNDDRRFYSLEKIIYRGGAFIVQGVIENHGEAAILWFIKNRFSFEENFMRPAAIAYRQKAFDELGQ